MVKGVSLGLDWSLGFLHHYHHDFYDIRYPAETGCFGTTLGGLGMRIGGYGVFGGNDRWSLVFLLTLAFGRNGVNSRQ